MMNTLAINRNVLILNTNWCAVGVEALRDAIGLLFSCHPEEIVGAHGVIRPHPMAGQPKAKVIDPGLDFQTFTWSDWAQLKPAEGEDALHGAKNAFRIPEVLLLTSYDSLPVQRIHFSRRTIYRRDNFHCQYCGCKVGNEGTIDHILPRSQGGQTTWENCVLACVQCNSQKANRTPQEAYRNKKDATHANWKGPSPMVLLSTPKKPKFSLLKGDRSKMPKSWSHFISEAYWSVELQNDNTKE